MKMLDNISQYAETVGGLRKALLAQGFSEEAAEQLVIEAVVNSK
jgi:hypothetical protein